MRTTRIFLVSFCLLAAGCSSAPGGSNSASNGAKASPTRPSDASDHSASSAATGAGADPGSTPDWFLDPTDFGTDFEGKAPKALTATELGSTPARGGVLDAVSRDGDLYDGPAATESIVAYDTVAHARKAFDAAIAEFRSGRGDAADGDTYERELSLKLVGDEMVAFRSSHEGDASDADLAGKRINVDDLIARVGAVIVTLNVRGLDVTEDSDQARIADAVDRVVTGLGG